MELGHPGLQLELGYPGLQLELGYPGLQLELGHPGLLLELGHTVLQLELGWAILISTSRIVGDTVVEQDFFLGRPILRFLAFGGPGIDLE